MADEQSLTTTAITGYVEGGQDLSARNELGWPETSKRCIRFYALQTLMKSADANVSHL